MASEWAERNDTCFQQASANTLWYVQGRILPLMKVDREQKYNVGRIKLISTENSAGVVVNY